MAPHATDIVEGIPPKSQKADQGLFTSYGKDKSTSVQAQIPVIPKFDSFAEDRQYQKQHAAAAFRYLSKQGFDEGIAGHISLRDPEHHDQFWINPLCKAFSTMKASDLVLVDEQGTILKGGNQVPINPAGFMIHSAIHKARPDVNAAVHAHTVYGKAFSALGVELDMISQDACNFFYQDHSVYTNFGGTVLDEEESGHIAKALGNNSSVILQNHGLLTVGHTVDEAAYLFGAMDRLCHAQLLVDAAAQGRGIKTKIVGDKEAKFSHDKLVDKNIRWMFFQPAYEELLEETGGAFLA
ncbi:hypothetical protein B0A52_01480 [Exophiala mesophila]|uniref:Class II aldolase/adducin N-terminal domain-containing protein n=1 Tax=Exophiala mesophila TaxID=212818 RepID=A0A438NF76_EXOME|nr:hypothetical protein B0A52_01480 [Exophiala mesophila]